MILLIYYLLITVIKLTQIELPQLAINKLVGDFRLHPLSPKSFFKAIWKPITVSFKRNGRHWKNQWLSRYGNKQVKTLMAPRVKISNSTNASPNAAEQRTYIFFKNTKENFQLHTVSWKCVLTMHQGRNSQSKKRKLNACKYYLTTTTSGLNKSYMSTGLCVGHIFVKRVLSC